MRKDRIEERIAGIERDMKEMRSELRQEIASMAAELKEAQVAMLEDMTAGLQDAMSAGYRQIAYEMSIGGAEKRFNEEMCHDCPPTERDSCIAHFVEEHLRKGIDSMDGAPQETREKALAAIVAHDDDDSRSFKGTACERCQWIYIAERDRLLGMEKKFTAYRNEIAVRRSRTYFKQLPDDLTVSELIDPLSHRGRFIMLKHLTSGGMSFKELGKVTGYGGGHLIYHLNKLASSGLVSKEDSGLYQITDKGMGVMEVVRKMYGR
ncbi:MAG TPA: winged helix-turn-helix domain-containing protein [Methanocella sp.]|uniref:winged helix-turn-helix domain-containing protein n=1 Tax=Methanocella sp. TaxID=2052833 RepID=UPI002CD99181|nr:winged helix-turn-helix domain-containing protein [Methanocella sp.]HTY90491.1 winged helix-turn-helix domain-containing protein [Methanocella sp.]